MLVHLLFGFNRETFGFSFFLSDLLFYFLIAFGFLYSHENLIVTC